MAIDESQLEWDDEVLLYDGHPFTGILTKTFPNGGIRAEITYQSGIMDGSSREWHPSGRMSSEWTMVKNCRDGIRLEWHENGEIKIVSFHLQGIELSFHEWTDSGIAVCHRLIDWDSGWEKYALRIARERRERGE